MTFDEKMKALNKQIYNRCSYCGCVDCEFFEPKDDTDGDMFCAIRDNNKKTPWDDGWNMKVALGLEEPYNPVFPEEVRQSIMQHFERVE